MLDYDAIMASLAFTHSGELKMIAGWTYRDAGMDPIVVVIYDHQYNHFSGEGDPEDWRGVERRMVTVQGNRGLSNLIIDYMEGW